MKKIRKITAIFVALALGFAVVSCSDDSESETPANTGKTPATESFSNALSSLKAVEGVSGVYTVEFDGEYYLDDVIKANLTTASELLNYLKGNVPSWKTAKEAGAPLTINVEGAACSSIVAENANEGATGYIYGRNFDWEAGNSLIIHTMPDSGYESVSTCYLKFVSNTSDWEPSSNSNIENNAISLAGIYVPMDGMNEKGLYIANLNDNLDAVMPTSPDASKKNVQTTVAIRYILDKCATVDEAVAFLQNINMYPVYADEELGEGEHVNAYHFAIADNSGKSIVAEWVDETLHTTETKVVTNHNLYNESQNPATGEDRNHGTFERYDSLENAGEEATWKMTSEQVKTALSNVQQKHSVWSAVFEPCAKKVTYYFRDADATEDSDEPIDYTKPVVVQF